MLFQSQVPALMNQIGIKVYNATTQARKVEAAKRLNFYHDSQLERLSEQLDQLFSDPSSMVQVSLNIVKKVINNLSMVYSQPPTRTLDGPEKDQKLYAEILEQCAFDVKMKQAQRYTKLLKTILIRPVWRNDKIDLDLITGNLADVKCGDSPEILEAVLITNYGTSEKPEDITYSFWTEDVWKKLDYRGNAIESQPNPYEILPFIPLFDYSPPSSAFWLPGGEDLISQQEAINLKLTDLLHLLSTQSFGVGYIKGSEGGGTLKVDPGSLVQLGENGEIGFEAQQARIEEVVNAIDKLIKWGCISHGLSAASMSTDPQEASGLSKIVDNRELAEIRQDDIALFRSYEMQIFEVLRVVWNTHSTQKLSEQATLSIDFADPRQKVSATEQAQADDLKIAQGVLSPVDVIMRDNPDLESREDALAALLKIKEENKLLLTD
ncbi:hypothetical protein ACFL5W_01685 [Thermodesulfobacteriota bacterium]